MQFLLNTMVCIECVHHEPINVHCTGRWNLEQVIFQEKTTVLQLFIYSMGKKLNVVFTYRTLKQLCSTPFFSLLSKSLQKCILKIVFFYQSMPLKKVCLAFTVKRIKLQRQSYDFCEFTDLTNSVIYNSVIIPYILKSYYNAVIEQLLLQKSPPSRLPPTPQ